jgi:CheY-like chemotaxis protein
MSDIDQSPKQGKEHTCFITHPAVPTAQKNQTASRLPPFSASAFALHGKGTRKRTYVSSKPVPRIFVVDDEYVISYTLAAIFNMNGYLARYFTDPMEALAAAQSDAPDLLISDVAMPGLSGVDLAIQIRARYPTCKILLISGQAGTLDLLENARAQGHDFHLLLKPVLPSELLAEIGMLRDSSPLTLSPLPPVPSAPRQLSPVSLDS